MGEEGKIKTGENLVTVVAVGRSGIILNKNKTILKQEGRENGKQEVRDQQRSEVQRQVFKKSYQ